MISKSENHIELDNGMILHIGNTYFIQLHAAKFIKILSIELCGWGGDVHIIYYESVRLNLLDDDKIVKEIHEDNSKLKYLNITKSEEYILDGCDSDGDHVIFEEIPKELCDRSIMYYDIEIEKYYDFVPPFIYIVSSANIYSQGVHRDSKKYKVWLRQRNLSSIINL